MIVTCPGCASKYRVRDEAVPSGGAELKCPSCGSMFKAMPPKHSDEEIAVALERITKAKEAAELRVGELEGERNNFERRAVEAEARVQQFEAQMIVVKSELGEMARLKDEHARAMVRAQGAQDAELRVLQLTEEVARARAAANHAPEVARVTEELHNAEKLTGRLFTELEEAKQTLARIQGGTQPVPLVLPDDGAAERLRTLVAAVDPMLWGLEQAIAYLEPFGATDAGLSAHVRQLQLLQAVLKKLAKS